jgi:hypothetical protein
VTGPARRPLLASSNKGVGTSRVLALISGGLAIFGLIVIILYAASTPGRSIRYIGVGVLAAIAALVTGCLLGFLFGIPKVVSSGELRHRKSAPTEVTRTQTPDTTVTTSTIPPSSTPSTSVESTADIGTDALGGTPETSEPVGASDANSGDSGSTSPFAPSTNLSEVSDWLTKLLLGAGLVELTHLGGPLGKLINAVAFGLGRSAAVGVPDSAAQVMAGSLLITYFVLGFLDGYVLTTLWYGSKVRGI